MINKLEERVSKEEDKRIMNKTKTYTNEEKWKYYEGYADGILYSNLITREIYNR